MRLYLRGTEARFANAIINRSVNGGRPEAGVHDPVVSSQGLPA